MSHGATAPSGPEPPRYRGFTITHSDTRHSVGLLWTSDQPDAPDNTQHSQQTDIQVPGGIRTHNPSKQAATNPGLRLRGHWGRQTTSLNAVKVKVQKFIKMSCSFFYILRTPAISLTRYISCKGVNYRENKKTGEKC